MAFWIFPNAIDNFSPLEIFSNSSASSYVGVWSFVVTFGTLPSPTCSLFTLCGFIKSIKCRIIFWIILDSMTDSISSSFITDFLTIILNFLVDIVSFGVMNCNSASQIPDTHVACSDNIMDIVPSSFLNKWSASSSSIYTYVLSGFEIFKSILTSEGILYGFPLSDKVIRIFLESASSWLQCTFCTLDIVKSNVIFWLKTKLIYCIHLLPKFQLSE